MNELARWVIFVKVFFLESSLSGICLFGFKSISEIVYFSKCVMSVFVESIFEQGCFCARDFYEQVFIMAILSKHVALNLKEWGYTLAVEIFS